MEHSPIQIPPPEALAGIPTPAIAFAIDQLIAHLDERDGDADLEETDAEDSFVLSWYASGDRGPGCPVADQDHCAAFEDVGTSYYAAASLAPTDGLPGDPDDREGTWRETGPYQPQTVGFLHPRSPEDAEDDDPDRCAAGDDNLTSWGRWAGSGVQWYGPDRTPGDPEDAELGAWPEWHTRGRRKTYGGAEMPNVSGAQEDAEDDDPGGGTGMEDEFDTRTRGHSWPGCPIADPGGCEHDGREAENGM